MSNADRARKMLVRTALVTSATVATLIGAQSLAMLDARAVLNSDVPDPTASQRVLVVTPEWSGATAEVKSTTPEVNIQVASPSITILRQSGALSTAKPNVTSVNQLRPPSASLIVAPEPVILQQPAPERGRSSR